MMSQRQYDETVVKAAEALPRIAKALEDMNAIRCLEALSDHGEIDDDQMTGALYAILARKEEPKEEKEPEPTRIRYSEEYRKRRNATR